jgi:hypothetical protein
VVISSVDQRDAQRTEMMRESPGDKRFGVFAARLQKFATT